MIRPDEVQTCHYNGESRYPVQAGPELLALGLSRGDEYEHLRAGSIWSVLVC